MDLRPSQENTENHVVTIVGAKKLRKDKILKIRLDQFELSEVDRIANLVGFRERATAIRYLLTHFEDMRRAEAIVKLYNAKINADKDFANIIAKV